MKLVSFFIEKVEAMASIPWILRLFKPIEQDDVAGFYAILNEGKTSYFRDPDHVVTFTEWMIIWDLVVASNAWNISRKMWSTGHNMAFLIQALRRKQWKHLKMYLHTVTPKPEDIPLPSEITSYLLTIGRINTSLLRWNTLPEVFQYLICGGEKFNTWRGPTSYSPPDEHWNGPRSYAPSGANILHHLQVKPWCIISITLPEATDDDSEYALYDLGFEESPDDVAINQVFHPSEFRVLHQLFVSDALPESQLQIAFENAVHIPSTFELLLKHSILPSNEYLEELRRNGKYEYLLKLATLSGNQAGIDFLSKY